MEKETIIKPKCCKRDCKANERGHCVCLIDNRFKGRRVCPFYKSRTAEILDCARDDIRRGKWMEKKYDNEKYYVCSTCGNSVTVSDGIPLANGINFCPYCGADMRKERK